MKHAARPRAMRRLRAGALRLVFALPLLTAGARAQDAYVTAQLANAVAVVDLASGKVTAQIAVDGAPAGIAFSPDRKSAYVTRPESGSLAVIDLDSRKVVTDVAVPGGPLGIAVNPRSGAVYVSDWYAARVLILEYSATGLTVSGEIAVGKSPSGLAVTSDGTTLLAANRESDSVSVIDLAQRREVHVIPVGQHPFGLTLSADGTHAYTANVVSNDVSVIDLTTHSEIGRVRTGERPYVVALVGKRGFVTNQYANSVTVFGLDDLSVIKTIDVDDHPEGIAPSHDGKTLIVANWGDNTLSVIDVATLEVASKITVPDGPRAFGDFVR